MTLVARVATASDREPWDAFVAARGEADVLQAWAWGEAGAREEGETWTRLLVADGEGRVRGVAQVLARATYFGRRVLYVPHGPVWEREADDAQDVIDRLLDGLVALGREQRGVVLKLDPRAVEEGSHLADTAALLLARGLRRARHDLQAPTTRVIDLAADRASDTATWSRDARAELRRAQREGVVTAVSREVDPTALDAFLALLVETSERGGFRMRSRVFLDALAQGLAASHGWFLALSSFEGRPVAGAVASRVGDRAFYLYAASTRDPELGQKRGPYAVMAGLMRALAEAGVRSLDLWGVREADDASVDWRWEGFSLFKRRFGGRPLRHPGTFDLVIDPLWDRLRELRERLREGHR